MDGQSALFKTTDAPLLVRVVLQAREVGDEFTLRRDEVHDIKRLSDFDLEGVPGVERLERRDRKIALDIAHLLVTPNLVYNRQETLTRRQKAKDAVLPVQITIQKNQTIVAAGTVIQPMQMALVNELNTLRSSKRTDFVSVVVAFLFMILIDHLLLVPAPYRQLPFECDAQGHLRDGFGGVAGGVDDQGVHVYHRRRLRPSAGDSRQLSACTPRRLRLARCWWA